MTLFNKLFSEKTRAGGLFLASFNAAISQAAAERRKRSKTKLSEVADRLEVDRSMVTRILKGAGNPTIRTIGELAWALGMRPEIRFVPIEDAAINHRPAKIPSSPSVQTSSSPVTMAKALVRDAA
jgi:transcriptional regulator with XRE-family HTH domain